jgi:GNAT superfamily N-acetyltransferase
MTAAAVTVSVVDADATHELRRTVLRPQWPPGSRLPGDGRPGALYLAAREEPDGAVLSACVIFPQPYLLHPGWPGSWQLRGMATADGARGRGLGALIVSAAVDIVCGRGGQLLWCEARVRAIPFYERNGFTAEGEVFLHPETAIPHRHMWRELGASVNSSTTQQTT